MDQRTPPFWCRIFSRIRNRRQNYHDSGGHMHQRRPMRTQSSLSVFRNQRFQNHGIPFTRSPLSEFRNQRFQNPGSPYESQFLNHTPKCLSGVSSANVLRGVTSDDFSRNCWLEDSLHMFSGDVSTTHATCDDININESRDIDLGSIFNNFCEMTDSSIRSDESHVVAAESTCSSDVSSDESIETVSDVTRFFDHRLSDFSFGPTMEPPPYSADPPPAYTEHCVPVREPGGRRGTDQHPVTSVRPVSTLSTLSSSSSRILAQAFLW